jgi:hypothetical protein
MGALEEHMVSGKRQSSPKKIWAYTYQILQPQAAGRLRTIQALLDHEHGDAERGGHTWAGRIVREPHITLILIVSDSPDRNLKMNRKLDAELKKLNVEFLTTAPMAVEDEDVPQDPATFPALIGPTPAA